MIVCHFCHTPIDTEAEDYPLVEIGNMRGLSRVVAMHEACEHAYRERQDWEAGQEPPQ